MCRLPPSAPRGGLSNRDSPLFPKVTANAPKAKAPASDLCTSWVFSCFSLLFRSPFVRLSFSSSVTFFSRKLTYNREAEVGMEKTFESPGLRT